MKEFSIISEASGKELTKTQVRKIVKDEISKAMKKTLNKDDVKDIVRGMMIKQYKFFWEKKSFWVNNI